MRGRGVGHEARCHAVSRTLWAEADDDRVLPAWPARTRGQPGAVNGASAPRVGSRDEAPDRTESMSRAASRPSEMAQTMRLAPRRASTMSFASAALEFSPIQQRTDARRRQAVRTRCEPHRVLLRTPAPRYPAPVARRHVHLAEPRTVRPTLRLKIRGTRRGVATTSALPLSRLRGRSAQRRCTTARLAPPWVHRTASPRPARAGRTARPIKTRRSTTNASPHSASVHATIAPEGRSSSADSASPSP